MPVKALVPSLGRTCGRREREAGAGSGEERSSHVPVAAAVEGTLVHGAPASFAGGRKSVGLGRFVRLQQVSSSAGGPTGDSGCPLEERGRERGQRAQSVRTRFGAGVKTHRSSRTRPSLGPETRARRTSLTPPVKSRRRWRGSFGIAVGQTCASRRNRHRDRIGRTNARLAAHHRCPRGTSCVMRETRQGGHGHRAARGNESPGRVARTSYAVAEVVRRRLVPNTHARSAPKRVAVRVNGGLGRRGNRRESVGRRVERKGARWSASPV